MDHKENDFRKICFHCASIYESEDSELLVCPVCGKEIKFSDYEGVLKNIRMAVFSGWTCRIEYENEESGRRYYTEHCGEILNFIGLTIVTGIIGNAPYDLIKKVLNQVILYLKRNKKTVEDEGLVDFLSSSERIKKFSEYLAAYYDEYENVDTQTRDAILEEVFVDQTSHIIDGLIRRKHGEIDIDKVMSESPYTKEDIMKMALEIKNRVNSYKLKSEDFETFWDKVE